MAEPRTATPDPEDTLGGEDFIFGEEAKPESQALGRADLLARLTALMQSCEGCDNVRVVDVTRLDKPEAGGCNWSTTLVLAPGGVAPEVYALAYAQVIVAARKGWNLQ
jgi:phosphoglycerate dehydrogenase-like enzyme